MPSLSSSGPPAVARYIAAAVIGTVMLISQTGGPHFKIQKLTPTLAIRNEKIFEVKSSSGTGLYTTGSGNVVMSGTLLIQRPTDAGWSLVSATNQACNTTCTSACIFGEDTGVLGTLLSCSATSSDVCLCAGPN